MQCVVLQPKGTTRNTSIPVAITELPTGKDVGAILRRATATEKVGEWKWGTLTIHLFGYKTGKAGTENKHDLPAPYDETVLYGEAVLVATNGASLATFTTAQYTTFYNEKTGAVSDSESESDGEEVDSDVESAITEDVEEEEDTESESEAELLEEEEDEVAPPPPKVTRVKRINRKVPTWFSLPDILPESYEGNLTDPDVPLRQLTISRITCLVPDLEQGERILLEKGIVNVALDEAKRRKLRPVWENPDFQALYDIQCRRVLSNIASTYVHNHRLMTRYKEGEFAIYQIPYMTYADLYPEKWMELSEREVKREAKMLEVDTSMATDMYRCSRCGKRQCTYYEQQTRSADEPMTIFIRCVNCGKQWRQ
jgi:DNA-directed RNA polymerase subunit M/transcription elongation factor TFIIS